MLACLVTEVGFRQAWFSSFGSIGGDFGGLGVPWEAQTTAEKSPHNVVGFVQTLDGVRLSIPKVVLNKMFSNSSLVFVKIAFIFCARFVGFPGPRITESARTWTGPSEFQKRQVFCPKRSTRRCLWKLIQASCFLFFQISNHKVFARSG